MSRSFLFWMAMLVIAGFGLKKWTTPRSVPSDPSVSRSLFSRGPCSGKEKCVIYYSAPWCPVCEATNATAIYLDKKWNGTESKIGLQALLGADSFEKCKTKAEQLGSFAAADIDGSFGKQYEVLAYPTWLVLDPRGVVLTRVSVGIPNPAQADQFVQSMLKL